MAAPVVYADSVKPVPGGNFGLEYSDKLATELARVAQEPGGVDRIRDFKAKQEADPILYGWLFPAWPRVLACWAATRIFVLLGGNRCIRGDSLIFDPVANGYRRVDQIQGSFHVWAWDGEKAVIAEASKPFTKPAQPMFRVRMSSGSSFVATASHRVMRRDGTWATVGDLRKGDELHSGGDVWDIEEAGTHEVWDLTVEKYANYWMGGAYHHNSGKSTLCARLAIWAALNIPGARVRCWSANEETSINDQQRVIWNELPARYKNLPKKRYANYSIDYTQKNGFTGGKLILPPIEDGYDGGEIIFQTYKSWSNDDKVAEGWWAHLIWCDEEMPPKLKETLEYRLRDANGRMLISFTTINGWTALVASLLNKAKTVSKRFAGLLKRELPVEQNVVPDGSSKVFYFWTEDNIFLPTAVRSGSDMAGKPESEVLARHYGVPTKAKTAKFPLFNRDVHVVKHDDIPCIKDKSKPVTWHTAIDPAGSKPWCMGWGAVDAAGVLWITHEWPDMPTFGEWVDPSGDEGGKPGPAQRGLGYGINDYVDVIKKVESDIGVGADCVYRSIDPRMGASETQGENGAETIISRLDDKGYVYEPAPGKQVEDGEQLINDRLAYDQKRPIGVDNQPKLRISDRCEQLIYALENYAGTGPHEPVKDPVDWLRYMLQSGADFVDPKAKVVTGGGSY